MDDRPPFASTSSTRPSQPAGREREIVVLVIDAMALRDALQWEPPAGTGAREPGELFPHVYRAIPRSAVVVVEPAA